MVSDIHYMNMNGFERLPLCSVFTGALPENANIVNELSSRIEEQPDECSRTFCHTLCILCYMLCIIGA